MGKPLWLALLMVLSLAIAPSARGGLFDDGPSSKPPPKKAPPPPLPPLPPLDMSSTSKPPTDSTSDSSKGRTPPVPVTPTGSEKLPIPTDAQRRAVGKQIHDVLKDEFAKAKTAAGKSTLAAQMLQTADGTAESVGRYMLLRDAEDLAADAADVDTALSADDAVNKVFQPDVTATAIDPLQKLTRAPLDADASARVCEAALGIVHNAIELNRFDAARQAGKVAIAMAHKANSRELTDRATGMMGVVAACESEYARVAPAEAVLKKMPDDPAGNAAVGRYDCFLKGDWAGGLPKLAKGNNDPLKKAAADELKPPGTAAEQGAVADEWWGLAEGQSPAIQTTVRTHAATWYSQALDGLSGLAKLKAEQRIAQMQPATPKTAVATARPPKSSKGVKPVAPDDSSTTATGVTEISGPMDIIRAVPPEMYPKSVSEWTDDKQAAVNEALRKAVNGQKGTFQAVVQELYPSAGRVLTRSVLVGKISYRMTLYFDSDARSQLSGLRIGGPCIVTGTIYFPRFEGMELIVSLQHCTLGRG